MLCSEKGPSFSKATDFDTLHLYQLILAIIGLTKPA